MKVNIIQETLSSFELSDGALRLIYKKICKDCGFSESKVLYAITKESPTYVLDKLVSGWFGLHRTKHTFYTLQSDTAIYQVFYHWWQEDKDKGILV